VTDFPTSVDTFDNPQTTDNLGSVVVKHSEQHTNLNDAVEAVEDFLLNGSSGVGPRFYKFYLPEPGGALWHEITLIQQDGAWTINIDQTGIA
jgi:hypothetical protein